MKNTKGQNLLEYILFIAAVLVVCIYLFGNQSHGPVGTALNSTLNSMLNMIDEANSEVKLN